jgi:uncharacterized membrane protein
MSETSDNARMTDDGQGATLTEIASEPPRRQGYKAHRRTFWTMLISSIGSLTASLVLSIDAIKLAKDPGAALSCNINAIVSCGKVAVSWQSNLLGFPNAFIGLMCEPVVITVAIAALGGAVLPRWFMRTALAVYLCGLIFALWLFSQSYFVIGAFCPWCVLVTITTITVFASMLRVCALEGYLPLKPETSEKLSRRLLAGWDTVVITGLFSVIALAILFKYGNSIFT